MCSSDKSYKFSENSDFGRFIEATRDIPAGQVIIDERPIVSGPAAFSEKDTLCLVCCVRLKDEVTWECDSCGTDLFCSSICASKSLAHVDEECRVLSKIREGNPDLFQSHFKRPGGGQVTYNFVMVLRCLSLKGTDRRQVETLQSKVEALERVGTFAPFSILFTFMDEEDKVWAKHCLGAMRTNAFSTISALPPITCREGLYFISSFMSHSCLMNTDRSFCDKSGRMVTRAGRLIRAGEQITTSYLSVLDGSHERWKVMRETWFFTCKCPRCLSQDNEMDTHLSSIKCPTCSHHSLSPSVTDKGALSWKCACGSSVGDPMAWGIVENVLRTRPSAYESRHDWLISQEPSDLHPNHSAFVDVKLYFACQTYGRVASYEGIEDATLSRKQAYCEEILAIFTKLFGGEDEGMMINLVKGVILFECWSTLCEIHHRSSSSLDKCPKKIHEVRQKALNILCYGLEGSQEELMYQVLRDCDYPQLNYVSVSR